MDNFLYSLQLMFVAFVKNWAKNHSVSEDEMKQKYAKLMPVLVNKEYQIF